MKKLALALIGLTLVGSSAFAQTTGVLSRNAVGYVRIETVRSNFHFIANNFISIDNAPITVTNLIGNQVPIGSAVLVWDPSVQQYRFENRLITGWNPGTNRLNTGRGFWLKIADAAASNAYQVYLMGEVPDKTTQPTSTIPVTAGFNMLSVPYPVTVKFTNTTLAKSGAIGDAAILWNPVGKAYVFENRLITGWNPGTNTLSPGQAFWYRKASGSTNWVETKPYTWP